MKRFSRKTIEAAKHYVYGLRYPGSKKYFYIGKGWGNRVFSHTNQKIRKGIDDQKFEIIDQLRAKGGPEIDIIRHGLSEYQALLLESTIIDVLSVDQISNKVRGIDSDRFGLMSPKNLDALYKGVEFKTKHPCICFKINKRWGKNMSNKALYDSIRGNWRVNIERANKATYGIGVCFGIIRGIYKIHGWEKVEKNREGMFLNLPRWRFIGTKDHPMEKYLGYSLAKHPNHQVRGPLFYINC